MPNPFLYQKTVLFQTILLSINTQLNCQKHLFQAIQFNQTVLIQEIQFSITLVFIYTELNVKAVLFRTIQFSLIQFILRKDSNSSVLSPGMGK